MSELMKDQYYNYTSLHELAVRIKGVYPTFCIENFISDIMDETWEGLALKARMRKIAINLGKHLPSDFAQALGIIDLVIAGFPIGLNDNSLIYFPDFIEVFGQDACNWDLSIAAIERYTPSSTAEFAVRPFIIKHEQRMMEQMSIWAKHDNEHVRRLASEGCRPALPWGQVLTSFQQDPSPVIAILEQLKADPSLYVRKSVANNLNDISKTHPEVVANIARNWYGKNEHTDWIVKHGCRTLLKKGNRAVLDIFGFVDTDCVTIENFMLSTIVISIGDVLTFSFTVTAKKATKVRLEYAIDYVKANRKWNRKIFQISELSLKDNQVKQYSKLHSFTNLSSRKHYPGIHRIALIVNGLEQSVMDFEVLETNNLKSVCY